MKFMRLDEVIARVGLGRSSIYKYIAAGIFPEPVSLGERAVGWVEDEIIAWMLERIAERDRVNGKSPL